MNEEAETLEQHNTLALHVFKMQAAKRKKMTTYSEQYEINMDMSHTHYISEHVFGLLQLEMDYCDMEATVPDICS